ncbi:glycosyltransferase family 2 protein [Bergeyella sp. RCAD1439]|uniref:glycosyltransferase family 2 protein n=1 Tax=Bergeyella anatis TaxID=3113737 RepID=UPI002E18790E|nr:glycosyltransferase [Bergeyella sp. RCAD1439]
MKKVSVIVPVYNVERYLAKCLDSLVAQTLDDVEILVVNDGSTDGSRALMQHYANRYPDKIRIFDKENGGLSDARNYGLDRAEGEWIGFVDSDDYVTETMFEEMYALAQKHRADVVWCNLQKVNERGEVAQKLTQVPHLPEKILLKEHPSVLADLSYFACNKLFKRSLFEGKRFRKGMHFEDIQLIPQLFLQSEVVAQTQAYHYQYLERSDSITKTHNRRGLDILRAVADVEKTFAASPYAGEKEALKGFQILEGYYSFSAYLAFVKEEQMFNEMDAALKGFLKERRISVSEILRYKRFDQNYILSLPIRKKIYYLLHLFGLLKWARKLI